MEIPKLNWLFATLSVFGLLAGSVSQAGEATIKPDNLPVYTPKFYPFDRGEKGVYRATWNGLFSVATAEVTTTSSMVDGKRVYQVRVDAKTAKALDLIWKMRDTISSTFDAKSLSPNHYLFSQRENSRIIDTEAKLDLTTKRWAVNSPAERQAHQDLSVRLAEHLRSGHGGLFGSQCRLQGRR